MITKVKHIELFATSIIFTLSFLNTSLSGLPIVIVSGVPLIYAFEYIILVDDIAFLPN